MKRFISFSASVALLAACGGGGTSAPAETLPAGALVVTAVSGLRFDAETYGPVTAGSVMLGYSNEDSIRHTLIIAKGDTKVPNFKLEVDQRGSVDSGDITLDAGTYTIICDVPGHSNMKATLTVE
jgi:plastocyanin